MKFPLALTIVVVVACVVSLGMAVAVLVPAGDPGTAPTESPARELLGEVARAYQALGAYSDQGEFSLTTTINGQTGTEKAVTKLSFVRPDKFRLDAGEVVVVSDGKTMTTTVNPLKRYSEAPAPKVVTVDTFQQGPLGSILFGGPSARPMFILLNLLVGSDPVKAVAELGNALTLENDRVDEGVPFKVIRIAQAEGPGLRLIIHPETKLLKAIDLLYDPTALLANGAQDNVKIDRIGWAAGPIVTKDIPADTFAYQPPKEFTKVESIAQVVGAAGAQSPIEALVGKPAPNFSFTVLDGPGKTRTVTRDDLAGKVVLIDFWATWCEPCLLELPEIQKLVDAYARDKKDVVIIALSQDAEPSDPVEVRKLIEKTLDEHKINLTGNSVGLVGLDPSRSTQEAFPVSGLPTTLLIDGKGVVQEVHVGVPGGDFQGLGRSLGKSIDTLLEGKSLVNAAEEPAASNPPSTGK